ncbi:MAG TPA: hypothetical protein VFA71_09370 [Terriglobales bacterium]|nr:hypothetical protein [Terriglobales bacterium]
MAIMTSSSTEKRAALEEVLQSTTFLRADQLRKFLRYICEMEIEGRGSELCEFIIGVEAFGRPSDYSTAEDSVVRRRAVDLREKLHEVYSTELAAAKVRIDLPKGSYVPRFVQVEPAKNGLELASPFPVHLDHPFPGGFPERRRISAFWFAVVFFALGALATSLAFLVFTSLQHARSSTPAVAPEPGVTYEAEAHANTFNGFVTPDACEECSNGVRVRRIGDGAKNYVVINDVMVSKAGNYDMVIFYLLNGNRSFFVSVNDGPAIQVPLTGTNWITPAKAIVTVSLQAGRNKIKFYNDTAYAPDLDRIVIR